MGPDAAPVDPEYLLLRLTTAGGDLVLPHAIGIHGLLLLAVPAVLLARTTMSRSRQLLVIALAVASVAGTMILLLVQAFRQLPRDHLHPVALAAVVMCGAALCGGYAIVAAAVWQQPEAGDRYLGRKNRGERG